MPLIRQWRAAIGDRPRSTPTGGRGGLGAWRARRVTAMIQAGRCRGWGARLRRPPDELLGCAESLGLYRREHQPRRGSPTTGTCGPASSCGPPRVWASHRAEKTGLGQYFVTRHTTWYSGDERFGQMMFRAPQFRPPDHHEAVPRSPHSSQQSQESPFQSQRSQGILESQQPQPQPQRSQEPQRTQESQQSKQPQEARELRANSQTLSAQPSAPSQEQGTPSVACARA